MPVKAKPIIPKGLLLNPVKLKQVLRNAMQGVGESALVDFKTTTQTWGHQPEFSVQASETRVVVGTDDEIYEKVSKGTPPQVIVAKKGSAIPIGIGWKPKTRPRVIGSGKGSPGKPIIFRKKVNHPGIRARQFDEVIEEKWQDEFPATLQRAIDSTVE